jgi:hypothetical protein
MMTFAKIGEYVQAEPFRPFRIKMASGQTYEIRHPEIILVGRNSVRVYGYHGTADESPPQWHDVSMTLMETIKPLVVPSAATGN